MKEHIFNVHDVILLMTGAECVLLALFQSVLPAKNTATRTLLNVFLLAVAISAACVLVLWNGIVHTVDIFDHLLLPYFMTAALLVKGPALYLYVRAITETKFSLDKKLLVHLTPVVVVYAWMMIFKIDSVDLRFATAAMTDSYRQLVNCVWHFVKIVPAFYAVAAVMRVNRYKLQLVNQYSSISSTEPGWLGVLTYGFLGSWMLTLLVHIIAQFASPFVSDAFGIADNYVGFILINALFLYSVVYAHQLLSTKPEAVTEPEKSKSEEKIQDTAILKVTAGMEQQKHYLKHNLNIEEFSKRIDLPIKDVSLVINKHYGTNFFEFINKYRVEEAKRLLVDPNYADKTILDILLQAGFNSKSAFHRFFNRLVGMSPSEYRKQHGL